MASVEIRPALLSAFDEVLDKMAFMFFEEEGAETPEDGYGLITRVTFDGVIRGSLNIMITRRGAEEIARNLIGITPGDALYESTLEDGMCEFTNLVMGRTMTVLNPAGPFEMDVPGLARAPDAPAPEQSVLTVDGMLDDEPFRMRLLYQARG